MNGSEGLSDFKMDKEAPAVGQYWKIKAWFDNLELLYGGEDTSFVGLLYQPNLFLFNFTFGDVKEAAGEGCFFLFGFSKDIIRSKIVIL